MRLEHMNIVSVPRQERQCQKRPAGATAGHPTRPATPDPLEDITEKLNKHDADLAIQFRRIAQLQAELDELKRALLSERPQKPRR
jgi:hypothetical protein